MPPAADDDVDRVDVSQRQAFSIGDVAMGTWPWQCSAWHIGPREALNRPASSIVRAPISSAGWAMKISVPCQRSFRRARAVPTQQVMWSPAGVHDVDFLAFLVACAALA